MKEKEGFIKKDSIDIDSTLDDISRELGSNETLILDVDNNSQDQTDIIYDTLVLKGYNVSKSSYKGKSRIIVSRKKDDHI